ncbi:MAG: histidine phosphatase family protein [Dermatophilaceae bacterium]
MRLLLIRHGQTASNLARLLDTAYPGAELDETGREQADALVTLLDELPLDAIYVSDLVRSQQTAGPLALKRGLEPIVRAGIREIQAGDYEMSDVWEPYVEAIVAWGADIESRIPGGESGREVMARFDGVVREAHDAGYETVALVSHGAMIRTWAARVGGLTPEFMQSSQLHNTLVVEVHGDPASGWKVVRWGDLDVP